MSRTFVACVAIAFAWMGLFFLWGRSFLTFIHAERDVATSVSFGFLLLQVVYQIIYLPFCFTKGSYRATVYIWICLVTVCSVLFVLYLRKHPREKVIIFVFKEKIAICFSMIVVLGFAIYISLHVPFYGADTMTYITTMNNAYYQDSMWVTGGTLSLHHGLCSMFHFFTISSLITGIKPYYTSLFVVRIVGVCLSSFILYRIGYIAFKNKNKRISWPGLGLSIIAPALLMFWGSNYTAEFYYWRINEAKGYCQFVLLPLGFSVFLAMLKYGVNRTNLWKEQLIVGLAAVPVSTSSLTPYIFLVFMGIAAVLASDKLKDTRKTIGRAIICVTPNIIYLVLYILEQKGLISI